MSKKNLAHLALTGLLGLGMVACGDQAAPPAAKKTEAKPAAAKAKKAPAKIEKNAVKTIANTMAKADAAKYTEVHDCAGKNICKGLGGCKVDDAKLEKLAKAVGKPLAEAGSAHDCKGKNFSAEGFGEEKE